MHNLVQKYMLRSILWKCSVIQSIYRYLQGSYQGIHAGIDAII